MTGLLYTTTSHYLTALTHSKPVLKGLPLKCNHSFQAAFTYKTRNIY